MEHSVARRKDLKDHCAGLNRSVSLASSLVTENGVVNVTGACISVRHAALV